MKKSLKIFFAAVFIFTGAVVFSVKTQADFSHSNSENLTNNSSAQKNVPVRTLFLNNCARCHGANGNGDTELGKLYDTPNLSGGRGKKISRRKAATSIRNGKGSMPAFKQKLSTAEINSLANYIRTL